MHGSQSKSAFDVRGHAIAREFAFEQLPVIAGVFALGIVAAYLQHGFLPGGEVPFPLAQVRVPIWHVVWMGIWTGYTMAVVGEAAGIFALPYTMSILQFTTPNVTPTTQLLTFLNPLGALLGFRRSRQWNLALASWVCLGGVVGGLIGPFVRMTLLSRVEPFTFTVGIVLVFTGFHLCLAALRKFVSRKPPKGIEAKFAAEARARQQAGLLPSGLPDGVSIETVSHPNGLLTVKFWNESWTVRKHFLFITGAGVGVISSALGVGGGFLLVPIFSTLYGLPMYVLVAATIPYVMVLSAVGLFTYGAILPMFLGSAIQPEWAFGLFAAAGGIFGSWCAAKTQRYVSETALKLMLGGITAIAGALYVINFFFTLPFRL
jgi:uncharacterized membrane protein YfcA